MRTLLFCLSLILLLPLSGQAAGKVLRVSFNELPPWKILDESGVPYGIDVEFLRLVAQRMELEVEFVHLPFKRGLKMVEHGNIDLMFGVLRRPEREVYAHFLTPPYKDKTNKAFYVLKGNEDLITKYEDLHSLTIGTQLGGKYFPRFDADEAIKKHAVKDTDLSVKMLLAGRIDAYVNTEATGDYRLVRKELTDVVVKAKYVYSKKQDVYMVLSKLSAHADRLDEFKQAIGELVESGEFDRIRKEFFTSSGPWNQHRESE